MSIHIQHWSSSGYSLLCVIPWRIKQCFSESALSPTKALFYQQYLTLFWGLRLHLLLSGHINIPQLPNTTYQVQRNDLFQKEQRMPLCRVTQVTGVVGVHEFTKIISGKPVLRITGHSRLRKRQQFFHLDPLKKRTPSSQCWWPHWLTSQYNTPGMYQGTNRELLIFPGVSTVTCLSTCSSIQAFIHLCIVHLDHPLPA